MAVNYMPLLLAQAASLVPQSAELPAVDTSSAPAPNTIGAPPAADPGIVVTARKDPTADIGQANIPQIAQPEYLHQLPGQDPAAVDPNNPAFLDRRLMDYNANEAQKAAAAKAAGGSYTPKYQYDIKDFKAHPGLEFGTHGVLRDIIGNAVDFLGGLIGRRPSYAREKLEDRLYGWDQPGQLPAAISRGMQYDPQATQEFLKNISSVQQAQAATQSLAESRQSSAQARALQGVTGISSGIMAAKDPAAAYKLNKAALQKQVDAAGLGISLPDEYDENAVSPLTNAGYTGSNLVSERNSVLSNAVKAQLFREGITNKTELDAADNSTKLKVASIMANNRLTAQQRHDDAMRAMEEWRQSVGAGQYGPVVVQRDIMGNPTYADRSTVVNNAGHGTPPVPGALWSTRQNSWVVRGPNGLAIPYRTR